VVLEKDGEERLDRLCKINITKNQGGEEYPPDNKKERGVLNWLHLALEMFYVTQFWKEVEWEWYKWERRRGRRCKQQLDDFKKNSGYNKLKGGTQVSPFWKTRFEGNCGPILKQTVERMGEII